MQRERGYEFTSSYEHTCGSFARKFLRPRNLESVQFSRVILKYIHLCRPLSRAVFTRFRSHSPVSECSVSNKREKEIGVSPNLYCIFAEKLQFNFSVKIILCGEIKFKNVDTTRRDKICQL